MTPFQQQKGTASPQSLSHARASSSRHSRFLQLYFFLAITFCIFTVYNVDVSKNLMRSLEDAPVLSSSPKTNPHGDANAIFLDDRDEFVSRLFQETLKLDKLVGKGDVSFGFMSRYQNQTVITKVATDRQLYYSDIEIDIFRELNKAPSIPNIPQLQLAIRSMPNPFAAKGVSYLVDDLGLKESDAEKLVMKLRISVIVMKLLKKDRNPKDLEEVQRFMESLLETMEFVHSRNIMHCDLHPWNIHWDGKRVYLFDWNGAFRYEPNTVKIHYPGTALHLFPPEATYNKSAVHTSVYAFDMYTVGKIMKRVLDKCCGINFDMLQEEARNRELTGIIDPFLVQADVAYELASYMMYEDPYTRPNATQALQHLFFTRRIPKNTTRTASEEEDGESSNVE